MHHCPGAKVKPYVKMGPCYIANGCCRTHQIQCRAPECKGWIYMNRDRCIKCEQRAKVSFGIVAWWMKRKRADFRAIASQAESQRGRRWEESKARTRIRRNPCTSLADQGEEPSQVGEKVKRKDHLTSSPVSWIVCQSCNCTDEPSSLLKRLKMSHASSSSHSLYRPNDVYAPSILSALVSMSVVWLAMCLKPTSK